MHPGCLDYEILFLFREEGSDRDKAKTCSDYTQGGHQKIRSVGEHQPASLAWPTAPFSQPLNNSLHALGELSVG